MTEQDKTSNNDIEQEPIEPTEKPKKTRQPLTLEEREKKAKKAAQKAAKDLARIREAKARAQLHHKAAVGEIVFAIMKKEEKPPLMLDIIINKAIEKKIALPPPEKIQELYAMGKPPAEPDPEKK